MIENESKLGDKKIDFVTIVTPNFAHFAPAMKALDKGFHVVIEKPIAFTLDEAKQLKKKVEETGLILCLTHTYSGYPMVKQARQMVKDGVLGKIRKVYVEYPQGWLSKLSEKRRQCTGRLENRSEKKWQKRLHGRHRHSCRPPRRIYHRVSRLPRSAPTSTSWWKVGTSMMMVACCLNLEMGLRGY